MVGTGARRAFLFEEDIITMNAPITYLKHVREEFSHIVWPTRQKAIAHTLIVIIIAAAIAAWVGILDYGFGAVVSYIVGG